MHSLIRPSLFLLSICLVVTGCQDVGGIEPDIPDAEAIATVSETRRPILAPSTTSATVMAESPSVPTSIPTTAPLPTATAVPLPVAVLAVPTRWAEVGQEVISEQTSANNQWQWQLEISEKPEDVFTERYVDMALVRGEDGILVRRDPLVLAVPFTLAWEQVSGTQAQSILDTGHQSVNVMKWAELPPTKRALRVDGRHPLDADYPFHESWSLVFEPRYEETARALAVRFQALQPAEPLVHLAAVGDIMLDRSLGQAIQQGNLAFPFARVAEQLQRTDITIGNLESSLGDVGNPADKHYTFQAPPEAAEALAFAGFDVMTLANNHAMDYGPEALVQAIDLLDEHGISVVGAGANATEAHKPLLKEVNGLTVAFLGYVNVPVEVGGFDTASWTAAQEPGLAWGTPEVVAADVAHVLPEADVVIVALHSGLEYVEAPGEEQMAVARAAIDAGAHLVLGHHAHILQAIEFYNQGVIVYGLGNFAFQIEGEPETAILNVWLDRTGVRQLEIVPAVIQFGGQPRLAESWETQAILQRVYRLTDVWNASQPTSTSD